MIYVDGLTIARAMTIYGLTRNEAAILVRLNDARGFIVEMQPLRDAVEEAQNRRTTEDGIRSAIKRARRKLAGHAKIKAASGMGYQLIWLDGGLQPPDNPLIPNSRI